MAAGVLGGLGLLMPAMRAEAAEGPALTVVMDGSGSMWGKLGTERLAKFQVVRQGLAEALPKLPAMTRVGLVAFGHRRTGCQDVEVLRAPEAGEPGRIADMLNDFNPKGRGPVAAGLQTALETLPKDDPGTILLVHDDLDNCQQNPCALMESVRAQHPRVTIHVLSIGLNPADARQMQCLTVPTNGQHYVATSGAQILNAIAEVVEIAARTQPRAPAATAGGPAASAVLPEPSGPGVQLVAMLGQSTSGAPVPDLRARAALALGRPAADGGTRRSHEQAARRHPLHHPAARRAGERRLIELACTRAACRDRAAARPLRGRRHAGQHPRRPGSAGDCRRAPRRGAALAGR